MNLELPFKLTINWIFLQVVKEAEEGEKHKNGSSDKSAEGTEASENGADSDSNGVHENGSAGNNSYVLLKV